MTETDAATPFPAAPQGAQPWETVRDLIQRVAAGRDLTVTEAASAMEAFLDGGAGGVQLGAYLMALRQKGETVTEIVGSAMKLAERFKPLDLGLPPEALVELSSIGSERGGALSLAIGAGLVAAASGVKVVLQAVWGPPDGFGTAEVLSALGVNVRAQLPQLQKCMQEVGIAFLPGTLVYGDALARVDDERRKLGLRTIFDYLAALVSPAGARRQVIGVFNEKAADTAANVLKRLGVQQALVASGHDGLDAIAVTGKSKVCEVQGGQVLASYIQPEGFGLKRASPTALAVRTAEESALLLNAVLSGQAGPARDAVVLNAAATIRVAGFASSLDKAVEVARRAIASGRPKEILERAIKLSTAM